jgi:broad specificity phosphatase PhoE
MKIYFVRHGQTGGNVAHRHQNEHTPLTDLGRQQAQRVAEIVRLYQPTHLITSNLVRAVETARIIGEVCNLIPETNPNFIELRRPDAMYGHHHRSFRSVWFYLWWYLGMVGGKGEPEGESYKTLRERFHRAQEELMRYPQDARIVVVSHTVFIGLFTAHLCRKRALNPFKAARTFYHILTMPNTFITPIYYDSEPDKGECAWYKER